MPIHLESFSLKTPVREVIMDITEQVENIINHAGEKNISNGVCRIQILHTTAGLTINENADPDVKRDMVSILQTMIPMSRSYLHLEGNSDAHMKSSLIGSNLEIILNQGKLILGKWQGINLCEFDGPRIRTVYVQVHGE